MDRNLDNVLFKIDRNGKLCSVCFSDLTEKEMLQVLEEWDNASLKRLCVILGKTIKKIGEELDLAK